MSKIDPIDRPGFSFGLQRSGQQHGDRNVKNFSIKTLFYLVSLKSKLT